MKVVTLPGHGVIGEIRRFQAAGARHVLDHDSRISRNEFAEMAGQQQGQGETILLVEDEVAVRDATTKSLEKLGYRVLVAKDGVGATEIANNAGEIDLLLFDVVLPGGMSGIDISYFIRKQLPNLKYLFMSGYNSFPDLKLPEGAEIISKPVDISKLAAKVKQTLDG